MALRNICTEGDPALRKVCRPVGEITPHIKEILDDLVDTMRDADGVGLAAPQVAILRRMCVVEVEPGQVYEMINPQILSSEGDQEGEEGCLSVPGYFGTVHRPMKIKVEFLNREGETVTMEAEEMLARAMCHEIDHLDGKLYTDIAENVHEYVPEEENQ